MSTGRGIRLRWMTGTRHSSACRGSRTTRPGRRSSAISPETPTSRCSGVLTLIVSRTRQMRQTQRWVSGTTGPGLGIGCSTVRSGSSIFMSRRPEGQRWRASPPELGAYGHASVGPSAWTHWMGEDGSMSFQMTGLPEADDVLDQYPFAVVVGMMLDQQYGMEHAFRGGWKVLGRFATLDPAAIAAAEPEAFKELCSQPPAVHRFPGSMAARIQAVAQIVGDQYGGHAERIWTEAANAKDLFERMTSLPGFGKQKAQIFVALLAKQLGVRPQGWESVVGDYAQEGYRSVADVVDAASLEKVRATKRRRRRPRAGEPAARG